MSEDGYPKQHIFNIDKTVLPEEKMPPRTFIAREEMPMSGFKVSKGDIG